jgi:hypothetical protein
VGNQCEMISTPNMLILWGGVCVECCVDVLVFGVLLMCWCMCLYGV